VVLSWLEWVEVELRGFDDLLEHLRLLRGAVMRGGERCLHPKLAQFTIVI
jgi:hypothetical protein